MDTQSKNAEISRNVEYTQEIDGGCCTQIELMGQQRR
jgi:hypothetical protein